MGRAAGRLSAMDFVRTANPLAKHSCELICTLQNGLNINIAENSEMVDGLGGETWDGALMLSSFMSSLHFGNGERIVELGCGSGLCGLVTSAADGPSISVILTDRFVDLATLNTERGKL